MEFFRLLLVVLLMGTMWSAVNGQATYTTSEHYCFYCPRGTYVVKHCQEDLTNSICAPCRKFHYSDQPNSLTYCHMCKLSCPKWSKMVTDCTKVTNRKCECEYGYHKYPLDSIDDWKCRPHTRCSKGEGEVHYGNHTHDTKCEVCQAGEFVNQTDPKHPHCQACTLDSDSVCGPQGNVTRQVVPDTTTAPLSTSDAAAEEEHLSRGAIAGIVLAVIIIPVVVGLLIWKRRSLQEWYRNKRGGPAPGQRQDGEDAPSTGRRNETDGPAQGGTGREAVPLTGQRNEREDAAQEPEHPAEEQPMMNGAEHQTRSQNGVAA